MGTGKDTLIRLLKAAYARILAHYMRIHPRAAYHLINTTLNYGRLPIPSKTGGIYRPLTIRRHQATIIIRRERHICTLMAWGPKRVTVKGSYSTTDFADIITRTRGILNRQRTLDTNWRAIT